MWKLEHLQGKREINELHVPLGETVELMMTSQDVIRSFFMPAFRIKEDVLPGRYTTQWFKATKLVALLILLVISVGLRLFHPGIVESVLWLVIAGIEAIVVLFFHAGSGEQ